jgi:two-component system, sensor histidine kinase and response regulator
MNLNPTLFKTSKLGPRFLVAMLFIFLAMSLAILTTVYWFYVLNPRLLIEAESNAKILAESQAKIISSVLSSRENGITQDDIDELNDQVLVFIDPELKRPYFLGIALELDDEAVETDTSLLDLSEGNLFCKHCFPITTALYSRNSDELLGVANFRVSDVFYEKLKNDIKQILFLESLIALVVLFLVWIAVNFLIIKLNIEILSRKKITRELRFAKDTAEKASQTKSDFLANMSHEIRTPLNAIIGMTYILLKTPLNKRQQDLLGKLDSASQLLLNLINDLLDFSKIEAGKLELEAVPFKIDEVLNNLSELIMAKAGEKGLDILYHTSQDIPRHLIGDPLRLGQILLNLVNNALKFTTKGHILLSVEVAKQQQCHHSNSGYSDKNICLKFSITDTGIGIKAEDIKKLFNSFTQADNSTTRKYGGTGLGLSICKQLIKLMDGEINVDSIYGQGSTFSFSANFELDQKNESDIQPTVYTLPANMQQTQVLVVDDNPVAQNIFKQMLVSFGFRVLLSSSAQEGITLLKQHSSSDPIKLVLMDLKMPEMDGIKAIHIIKTQLNLDVTPTVFLVTAHASQNFNFINDVQWDDYLIKPVSQSMLYDSVITAFSENQSIKTSEQGKIIERKADIPSQTDLAHKQILLTEDNVTNQEVACALMEELKLEVSIANNGIEAVEAIKKTNFDLIFMDLQMPEMDGFEATRLIRQDRKYQHIPIIAMTAHAMQGDRQKCLDAQMDDYLTKPIDVYKFFAVLNKWLDGGKKELITDLEPIVQSTFPNLKFINLEKALLRVRGNQELLLRLLRNFKKQKFDIAEKISDAIIQKDFKSAKELLHNLKGEAGTLEATTLFLATQNLEQLLLEMSLSSIKEDKYNQSLIEVTQALEDVLLDISCFEHEMEKEQKICVKNKLLDNHLDMVNLAVQIKELAVLLKDNNLRAKILAKTIEAELSSSEYSDQWDGVLTSLTELNFELALQLLTDLAARLDISF